MPDKHRPPREIGMMLSEIIDYRGKTPPKSTSGIPLISAANVKNGRVLLDAPDFISEEDYEKWTTRGFTEPGDVLITTEAPAGEVALYPTDGTYLISRRVMAMRPNPAELNSRFLLYVLQWPKIKQKLLSMSRGTTVPRVLKTDITELEIPCPPIEEQRAIASILGALDDKIELNRRMNATLESLARAIFKSWFVDFDPVKINAGQLPAGSHDPKVLDLFPSTFQDSELGPIPKGWEVEDVGKHVAIKHGYAFKGEFFSKEPTRDVLLTPGNFAVGGGFKGDKLKFYEGPIEGEYILSPGDLIVTLTDLSKAGDTLGYPAFVPESSVYHFLHNQRLGRVSIATCSPVGLNFIHETFRTPRYRSHVLGTASGSTVKHSSPTRIRDHEIVVATPEIHELFEARVAPLMDSITRNNQEAMTLSSIRDRLLPKLLSGDLSLQEISIVMSAVLT